MSFNKLLNSIPEGELDSTSFFTSFAVAFKANMLRSWKYR